MIEFVLGVAAIFLGVAGLSLIAGLVRFARRRNTIMRFVGGMEAGVYVEHGMTIDPHTGLVTPQQRPSLQAYQHLL